MIDNSLFRLAGILYSNINTEDMEPSSDRMLLEIIESLFIENDNKAISVSDVYQTTREKFKLTFTDREIITTLKNKIEYFNFIGTDNKKAALARKSKNSIIFNLEEDRYYNIKSISNNFDIKKIVLEFWENNKDSFSNEFNFNSAYNILTEFIYNNFVNNLHNLGIVFQQNIEDILSLSHIDRSDISYKSEEKKLINLFLNYENLNKNKLIFYIMTLSFEYITAVNNSSNKDKRYILDNTEMFIDTNVFYRALGFNGEDRKQKSLLFFDKCKQIDQALFIMNLTYSELISSIENKFKHLASEIIATHSKDLQCLYSAEDPEYHYFEEQKNNPHLSPLLFSAQKVSELKDILKKYNIRKIYSKKNIILEQHDYEIIRKYAVEKSRPLKSLSSDILVIKNIKKWINEEARHIFFITTDKLVQKIDKEHIDGHDICLRPSDWLSYTLRYVNRTDDDYQSFVSFFNLNSYPERKMPVEFINKFLNFIKEADIASENKSILIESLCEQRFNEIITVPEDEQDEMFISFSNNILEEELKKTKENKLLLEKESAQKEFEMEVIKNNLDERHKELLNHKEKNETLEKEIENRDKIIEQQIKRIENENLEREKIHNAMIISKYKRELNGLYILTIIILISMGYLIFFYKPYIDFMNEMRKNNTWGYDIMLFIITKLIPFLFCGILINTIRVKKIKINELKELL